MRLIDMWRRMVQRLAEQRRQRRFAQQNPTAAKVRRVVPKCLVCGGGPDGHRFAEIASIPCNEETKPRLVELFNHVKSHEWEALKDYREFRADQNDLVDFAVTGPHKEGMVVAIRDPVELWEGDEVYLNETASADELTRIGALVRTGAWKDM